jgi:serine/threonine-protein kinase
MGEVWLAERADGEYVQYVALKLPDAAQLSDALRRRFSRERDILAALSHPHIARFLGAGVDGDRPYLVMEWVEGQPITTHSDERRLSVLERVALFGQVLEAVEHAHQRLVAHRDIKPTNIWVTDEGQVKLLDFGIAKLLDDESGAASTELTRIGGRALTPAYAAPEQLAGAPVTTAVDIYALGVVLYQLLAGQLPFDGLRRDDGAAAPLASTRVPHDRPQSALCRRALRGDLDAILAQALQTDPTLRYHSAAAFAADLQRVLRHEPIQALRIGWGSRAAKFVRRNRTSSALGAVLAVTMLAGVIAVAWTAQQARQAALRAEIEAEHARAESRRAEGEAAREKAVKEFLIGIFKASDPSIASAEPRGAITARKLLDMGARRIDSRFANDPETRIELLGIVAEIYETLDENALFGQAMQKRIELARAHYGDLHPVTLECLLSQLEDTLTRGAYGEAKSELGRLDELLHRAGQDESAQRAHWWFLKARTLEVDPAARTDVEQALARAAALYAKYAPADDVHADVLGDLGMIAYDSGDFHSAVDFMRRSVTVSESQTELDEAALGVAYTNLGVALTFVGDFAAGESAFDRAINLAEATYGRDTWPYWAAFGGRAELAHRGGDRQRAERLFDALLKMLPAPRHRFRNALEEYNAASERERIGERRVAEGRPAAALGLFAQARQGLAHAPMNERDMRRLTLETGIAESNLGHPRRALDLLRQALADYSAKSRPNDPNFLRALEALARAEWRSGDVRAAESGWRQVLAVAGERPLAPVALSCEGLARLAQEQHDPSTALDRVERGVALLVRGGGASDVRLMPQLEVTEARILVAAGRAGDALPRAEHAVQVLRRANAPGGAMRMEAEATLREVRAAVAPQ